MTELDNFILWLSECDDVSDKEFYHVHRLVERFKLEEKKDSE